MAPEACIRCAADMGGGLGEGMGDCTGNLEDDDGEERCGEGSARGVRATLRTELDGDAVWDAIRQ